MNITFFETDNYEKEYLEKSLKNNKLAFFNRPINQSDLKKIGETEVLGVFIHSHLNRIALEKLPNLKLIVTMSTGYDHIDLGYCRKNKIVVCNVPYYGEHTVAEHTFGLIIMLLHRIYEGVARVKKGFFSCKGLEGSDLKGKTLGVIGTGHIGEHVIRMAKAFDMHVVAHDIFQRPELAKQLQFNYVSLDDVLKRADIATLHVPLTKETHHIINSKALARMKKGAYLVNTSRGGLVDTKALIKALKSNQLAGAALDVLEHEPPKTKEEHELLHMSNVLVTPHSAFYTKEAIERILDTTIGNIEAFERRKLQNIVS